MPRPSTLCRAVGVGGLTLLLVAAFDPRPALSGAWVQPRAGAYLKTAWLFTRAEERRDCRGGTSAADALGGVYRAWQLHLYGEWGWSDRITLVGSWAWKDQRITEAIVPDYGTRSTGDLRLGARAALYDGRTPVSVEGTLSVPTYPATDLSLPVAEREQFLPAGSGEVEGQLRLLAGASLWPLPLYANLDLGYSRRGGAFGDQWLVAAEMGGAGPDVFAKLEARWRLPVGDPCASTSAGNVSFHERSLSVGPELGVRVVGATWLNAGWTTLVSGRNALDAGQWSLGVAFLIDPR